MFTSHLESARFLIAMIVCTAVLMALAFLRSATGQFDLLVAAPMAALAIAVMAAAIGRPNRAQVNYWRQVATVFGAGAMLAAGAAGGMMAG